MSAYRRWFRSGGTYFFTIVCECRATLFADAANVDRFRSAIARCRAGRPFERRRVGLRPTSVVSAGPNASWVGDPPYVMLPACRLIDGGSGRAERTSSRSSVNDARRSSPSRRTSNGFGRRSPGAGRVGFGQRSRLLDAPAVHQIELHGRLPVGRRVGTTAIGITNADRRSRRLAAPLLGTPLSRRGRRRPARRIHSFQRGEARTRALSARVAALVVSSMGQEHRDWGCVCREDVGRRPTLLDFSWADDGME